MWNLTLYGLLSLYGTFYTYTTHLIQCPRTGTPLYQRNISLLDFLEDNNWVNNIFKISSAFPCRYNKRFGLAPYCAVLYPSRHDTATQSKDNEISTSFRRFPATVCTVYVTATNTHADDHTTTRIRISRSRERSQRCAAQQNGSRSKWRAARSTICCFNNEQPEHSWQSSK